jgi:hypothetical protein
MKIKIHATPEREADLRKALERTGGYCPCVPQKYWNEDTKCMCKAFRDAPINTICHCGLYVKL